MAGGARGLVILAAGLVLGGCEPRDPELVPDAVLQRELGLDEDDVVHTVRVSGGDREVAEPAADSVLPGAYVAFVTIDWLVHEVAFEVDSLAPAARAFLERTRQAASPPLLHRDSRFVVSFEDAPPGRYPYRMEGNGGPGRGVIVVLSEDGSR